MTTTSLAALIRSLLLEGWRVKWRVQQKEGGREENDVRYKDRRRERDDSRILPAWRRHISGLSLGGKRRHLIVAEHGCLENSQEKSSCG